MSPLPRRDGAMSAGPFRRGRRLFSLAAVLLTVVAAAHTLGHLPLIFPDGPLPGLLGQMDAERQPLGLGMAASMLDIHLALVLTMSVTFAALSLVNLVVAAAAGTDAAMLRRLGWINAAWVGALVAVYAYFRVAPPLVSTALVELVILLDLFIPHPGRSPA